MAVRLVALSIFVTLASGCGFKVKAEVEDVRVVHQVDVNTLQPYLEAYCSLGNDMPGEIEACVNAEMGKLLTKF